MRVVEASDIETSIADALQAVSHTHPADFVRALQAAHDVEIRAPARNALLQLLINSKLSAVGGAAYLVAQTVRSARVVAVADLGMEAIYEFEVRDMPVTVAVDARGKTTYTVFPLAVEPAA